MATNDQEARSAARDRGPLVTWRVWEWRVYWIREGWEWGWLGGWGVLRLGRVRLWV